MENRNLQWSKRAKVPLILIFSVNTNHESVAYRSFSPSEFEARGARKVTVSAGPPPLLSSGPSLLESLLTPGADRDNWLVAAKRS